MSHDHELELRHRREDILRETVGLTSNVVQSLEQQQKLAEETKENLHNQNLLLSLANDKMRSMNQDLTSIVNEMNEIDAHSGCLCCRFKKRTKKKLSPPIVRLPNAVDKPIEPIQNTSTIPELIDNNEQEKIIVSELNQMKNQLMTFQGQVKSINKSFAEGDEIIQQLGNESNQYMHASSYPSPRHLFPNRHILVTTALGKAEHVLGRKFITEKLNTTEK